MGGESIVVDTKNGCRMLKVNICLFGYLVHVLFEWEISMLQAVKTNRGWPSMVNVKGLNLKPKIMCQTVFQY